MKIAETDLEKRGIGPQGWEAVARPLMKGIVRRMERASGSTPFRPCGARGSLDQFRKTERISPRRASERSTAAARNVWASDSIRQKIIGHRMAVCRRGFGAGLVRRGLGFRGKNGALALLDQPAGDHGVGVFVEPLVEKGRDLFAEIGRVAKPREFVALEGVAGSGEKELPGRLGAVRGHGILRGREVLSNLLNSTATIPTINSTVVVLPLWKAVEKSARACSGCAGDYEDPDRSAWEEDFEEEEPSLPEEAGDEPGADE